MTDMCNHTQFFSIEGSHEPSCPGWPGTMILPISASWIAQMTGIYHCAQLLVEMGVSETFCQGWPQTPILLCWASQVVTGGTQLCFLKTSLRGI
jgi:hypothetical protein